MRLKDEIAIVTGGGQGIGESISRRFALEGAKVVIADINPDTGVNVAKSINESGGNAISITTDVSDSKAVDKMVSETLDHFGKPTVLINNAGIAVFGPPLEITEEDWKKCFSEPQRHGRGLGRFRRKCLCPRWDCNCNQKWRSCRWGEDREPLSLIL